MNNYKIKVNNEAESKEAQGLFFELGYKFSFSDEDKLIRTSEVFNFPYFLGAFENGQMCFMVGKSEHQDLTLPQLRDLVAKSKPTEQGLISGKKALIALANGAEVETKKKGELTWSAIGFFAVNIFKDENWEFRLKPSTIKLNVEIPAPFEPSEYEEFYALSSVQPNGYVRTHLKSHALLGAWRTEEEIKQVVAALRGGIKG